MTKRLNINGFLKARAGSGFIKFALCCAVLSVAFGYGYYRLSLNNFIATKGEEKVTALELVDAFVRNYAAVRSDASPVPATFRAHSLDLFNEIRRTNDVLTLQWVGRPGRAIKTTPSDPAMAETIENLATQDQPQPVSAFVTLANGTVFRTVYPSVAADTGCVNCHNKLQTGLMQWRLGDVMGAFSIDVPAAAFLRADLWQSVGIGLALFMVLGGVGLYVAINHYLRLTEREIVYEAARVARDEAEAASRSKSEFLANMSHELRTPLNAVIGFSEAMLSEFRGPLNEHYRGYVKDIHNGGKHLLDLISDILDLSKAEAGKLQLSEEPVEFASIIEQARRFVSLKADDAGHTLTIDVAKHLPRIIADELKLKQIAINLLSNAVKFTPRGGRIDIAARFDEALGFTLIVRDNGIGIAPEHRERIFEPFVQVEQSFRRKHEGSGLGLALVKKLVALHGGEISIESALQHGTTVTVILPAYRQHRETLAA